MDEENEHRGFKVEDRRRFSATGDPREDQPAATAPPASEAPRPAPALETPPMPEMTFSTFVIGLSTQALILLGEVDDASVGAATDLAAAKQLVDILGILHMKTRGNLEEAEAGLLDHVLYDLRMKYVQRSRSK